MNAARRKWWFILPAVALVGGGGAYVWHVQEGLRRASHMADFGLWADARYNLDRYLVLHPSDDRAHLLYAEMLVKDERLPGDAAVAQALEHLRQIPDSAKLGATARLQEGRIEFLLMHRPDRAEKLLRRALEIDPETTDAYRVLWKLYDQTGRSHLAEPLFRGVYDREPWPDRVLRLREWYMSQFYPSTANPSLDRLMGFVGERENPSGNTEINRFIRFRNREPESPLGYAILARWWQQENDNPLALEILQNGMEKAPDAERDPFFLHTLIGILIPLGKLELAEEEFAKWPEPHAGYEYWLSEAEIKYQVRRDHLGAAESYRKALSVWPGPVDWRTRNLLVTCLTDSGDKDGAEREREYARQLEVQMKETVHRRIREALGFLNERQKVREIEDFYRKLNCTVEADGWRDHLAQLVAGRTIQPSQRSPEGPP